jgi:hypothetical protein
VRYRLRRRDGLYDVYECRGATGVRIAVALPAVRALALVRREDTMTRKGYVGIYGYNGQDVVVWRKGGGYFGTIIGKVSKGTYRVRYRSGWIVVVSGDICQEV